MPALQGRRVERLWAHCLLPWGEPKIRTPSPSRFGVAGVIARDYILMLRRHEYEALPRRQSCLPAVALMSTVARAVKWQAVALVLR